MDNQDNNQESQATGQPSTPGTTTPDGTSQAGMPQRPDIPQVISNNQKPKKRWPKILIALLLIIILAGAGWFFYKKNNKSDDSGATVSQNKDISLLKVGFMQADFGKLYPEMSSNDYAIATNAQMFEGLVRYENESKIVPDLATDWTNPDSKTWIFNIQQGVKFHDGNTMTAKDVKYSIDKILKDNSSLADTYAYTIDKVEAMGNDKLKITTKDADPTLLNKLTFLYVIDSNQPKGSEPSLGGTGPFMVKTGTIPTTKSIEMVAFDQYHGGTPSTKALSFGTEDNTDKLIQAFQNHQYDVVGYVPPSKGKEVNNAYHFITTASDVDYIAFNTVKAGPLQNKKVREAIRYAVNANAIGTARGSDITPLSQMIPESIPGYNPAITPYQQDIAKAKKLLTEAGYPNGLTINFSASSDSDKSTEEIAQELKAVGITLKIDSHSDFDEYIDYFLSGKADMYTVDYSSDTLDGLDIYQTTLASANYDNPKLTKILDEAGTTVDPAQRLKLLQDAAVIIDQDIPTVPLSTETDLWLMDNNYSLQQDMPSGYLPVYLYRAQLK